MKKSMLILSVFTVFILPNLALGGKCIVGDCINGQGTLIAQNGEKYIGEFRNGIKHGVGTYKFANGEAYNGEFKEGEPNGRGVHTYPDGGRYEGEFKNSLYEGNGTLTLPDGRKYVGEFSRGKAKGNGTLSLANGEKYIGEFADGIGNGKGKYIFPDGTIYDGEFVDFKYQGQGIMTLSDGTNYNGEFREGKRDGYGEITFPNGEEYIGQWKEDKKHGYGILIKPDGEKLQGIWEKDKFIKYADGYLPPEKSYTYKGDQKKNNKLDKEIESSSGTAFYINNKGHLITNNHVVNNCTKIEISSNGTSNKGNLIFKDEINDLAIVKSDNSSEKFAKLRGGKGIRVGEDIITVGYPLGTILGDSIKVTKGNISAAMGLANDSSMMQITAPIQPGSSGGPVLDMSGNVAGVVSAKLNELAMAQATGSLPQNINFAIKSHTLQIFLDTHGIDYSLENSDALSDAADITENAQKYTVRITCYQ